MMAYEALRHYSHREMTFRFVSNVDGTDFAEKTRDLDPEQTLFVVSSKTFTTLETMTNAQDRARVVAGGPGRRRGRGRQALRRRLDQRRRRRRVRHRHREHVRLLGVGRRPLLDGLGDRALDDAGDRPGPLRRDAGRLPRHGRALPRSAGGLEPADADGPAGGLVLGLLRRPDQRRLPLRPVPAPLPRLPAAADDGVQRQARHPRRRPRRLRHRRDLLGRAGDQRPAQLLPADPPGDAPDSLRLHRLRPLAQPARRPPRPPDVQRLRPGRGAGLRQNAGAGAGGGDAGGRSSRTG